MQKVMILSVFFLFSGNFLFSQTWTVRVDENFDLEWKVITKEEWSRLLVQKEAQYNYAELRFTDKLELENSLPVIKGVRPQLLDYYYLLGTFIARTEASKKALSESGGTTLRYGNDKTGLFEIFFFKISISNDSYYVGSSSYKRQRNQFIEWVNGKY